MSAAVRPPSRDWETDFDYLDPRWSNDPYPIWTEMRSSCPVAHTERFEGCYFPTTYAGVRAIAYDTESFSSRRTAVRDHKVGLMSYPPLTSDPPVHQGWKRAVMPPFTPSEVAKLEPKTRAICNELIDAFPADGGDVVALYTQHIPARLTAHMMGLPDSHGDLFRRWLHEHFELSVTDPSIVLRVSAEMGDYFAAEIAKRKANPTDDVITRLMDTTIDGRPAEAEDVHGMLRILLLAGVDTTWSAIGSALWHLAEHPADATRLRTEPELMRTAIEELLRAYAPVTMAREVVKDTTVAGCPMRAGEMVLLSYPTANRDPAAFPEPDRVILDRVENRHAAFGIGIHRCVGHNLARMELTVAIETFLRRVPSFRMNGPVTWSVGPVRGPRTLPMTFGADSQTK